MRKNLFHENLLRYHYCIKSVYLFFDTKSIFKVIFLLLVLKTKKKIQFMNSEIASAKQ